MKYELILFDLDGTLVDTLEAISKVTNSAMEELGLRTYALEMARNLIGNGVQGIAEKIFEIEGYDENRVSRDEMKKAIRKYYDIYFNYGVKPYDGIDRLLDFLEQNNIKKAVITNKDQRLAVETVEKNLKKWKFTDVIGADDEKYPRKPDPYSVNLIAERLKIGKEKILFVGDMTVDVRTAENAGTDIAYCDWGFGAQKNEEGIPEDIRVSDADELIRRLKEEKR